MPPTASDAQNALIGPEVTLTTFLQSFSLLIHGPTRTGFSSFWVAARDNPPRTFTLVHDPNITRTLPMATLVVNPWYLQPILAQSFAMAYNPLERNPTLDDGTPLFAEVPLIPANSLQIMLTVELSGCSFIVRPRPHGVVQVAHLLPGSTGAGGGASWSGDAVREWAEGIPGVLVFGRQPVVVAGGLIGYGPGERAEIVGRVYAGAWVFFIQVRAPDGGVARVYRIGPPYTAIVRLPEVP